MSDLTKLKHEFEKSSDFLVALGDQKRQAIILALLDKQGVTGKTIYSDSHNAILWVQKRQCKTKLLRTPQTEQLYQIIARAEAWLRTHQIKNPIVKWETKKWGEVPADFGRK